MPRTGIKTAPGAGPELELLTRSSGRGVPVTVNVNVGVWGYRAGISGTPSFPANARILSIACMGGDTAGTVTINGGDNIPVAANSGFGATLDAEVTSPTIVFTGTVSYFVQYVVEP